MLTPLCLHLLQTFTNEDHLSSHQKRHEMSLLLPGGITISRSNSLTLGGESSAQDCERTRLH